MRTATLPLRLCSIALCLAACSTDDDPEGPDGTDDAAWLEFREAATREADGHVFYVVDGDLRVDEDELREVFEALHGDGLRSTVNLFGGARDRWLNGSEHQLRYCVSNDFAWFKDRAVLEMRQATVAWENAAHVDFIYVPSEDANCTANNGSVLFRVRPWTENGAMAFFPSFSPAERTLYMNFSVFPTSLSVGVFRHELGHILGLRHEHIRANTGCGEDWNWEGLTDYDASSVMHYPSCMGQDGTLQLTAFDRRGVRNLYGPPVVAEHAIVDRDHDGVAEIGTAIDLDADRISDLIAVVPGTGTIESARRLANGTFAQTTYANAAFTQVVARGGAVTVAGDFDGDARTDVAVTGMSGVSAVTIAYSDGASGQFTVQDAAAAGFSEWATTEDAHVVRGDFDGDAKTDLAMVGVGAWWSIPVAFANGRGAAMTVTNYPAGSFPSWSATPGIRVAPGDYDGDGLTDIALVGGWGWGTVPVAFANGSGDWWVTNGGAGSFPAWAQMPETTLLPGDYDGDGDTDLALVGVPGWTSIPVARSNGDGSFTVVNSGLASFPAWAATANVVPLAADFDGDGCTDIALSGPIGWGTAPVALGWCTGEFVPYNINAADFALVSGLGGEPMPMISNLDSRAAMASIGIPNKSTIPWAGALSGLAFAQGSPSASTFAPRTAGAGARLLR